MEKINKKEIRKKILSERRSMSGDKVQELSRRICDKVLEQKSCRAAENVCLYMPINNEVDVTLMFESLWGAGKKVWLPKTYEGIMEFYLYEDGDALLNGNYGIQEPSSGTVLKPDDKTLVIMPGAVFSEGRDRIGYGGGYYDRYLSEHPLCVTAAVCFDMQIMERIPSEEHDIKPETIISEKRILD